MEFEEIRQYCLSLPNVEECNPFGPEVVVYKVNAKMFALLSFDDEVLGINLKNTPDKNLELRDQYYFVIPGFHMNKKHWNTVRIVSGIQQSLLKQLIKESYLLVAPKK